MVFNFELKAFALFELFLDLGEQAVKVGGRRTWRYRPAWVDGWLEAGQMLGLR